MPEPTESAPTTEPVAEPAAATVPVAEPAAVEPAAATVSVAPAKPAGAGRWLRLGLAGLGLLFLVLAARDLARGFDPSSVHIDARWLALSLVPALISSWVTSSAWIHLVEAWIGRSLESLPARALYFAAQVARYTPGKVGLPAVRMAGASALGVKPQIMGSTLLLEVLTWCTTGGATCGLVLACYPDTLGELGRRFAGLAWLAFGAGFLTLAICATVDRKRVPARLAQLLHLSGGGPVLPARVVLLYFVHWFGWVCHGALLGLAFGAAPERALLLGVALALGIIAGFLAFLAPAGAGVREAVVATVAAPAVGVAGALSAGLVARAISLTIDLVFWLATARATRGRVAGSPSP